MACKGDKMQGLKIIYKKVDELIPYENNPRNNDGAVEAVAKSIKEFGFKVPIVIDKEGVIVAGHTRLKAAKELELEEVPCIIADDLTPEQIKAFRLADNKVSEFAEWDFELLESELEMLEISELDFDMSEFGFNSDDLDETFNVDASMNINDEGLQGNTNDENKLIFGKTKVIITEDELEMLENKYTEYIDLRKVSYGFVRWLLSDN
ncbi:ParB N-terminal domain-containing protein [Peptoniphilus raoultii]|uniref:ParB N-terminal domain-containing protein n=1 Tax=Peptoniphilus raoultii TaxID=1776387 RepID=UPI000B1941BE|nr:ParB N-terminal domain-containing protein [Peptoniphilus raoultii]